MNNLSSNTPTIYSNAFSRRPVRIWLQAPTFYTITECGVVVTRNVWDVVSEVRVLAF